jgi:hypothetical protein
LAAVLLLGLRGCRSALATPSPASVAPAFTPAADPTGTEPSPSVTPAFTPSAEPTGTDTRKPTRTSAPSPPVEQGDSPVDTLEPTGEGLDIPIGIGIYDAGNVETFIKYANENDVISARPEFIHLLAGVETGRKMLNFNPRDEPLTDVAYTVSQAKALGVTLLGYNLEMALDGDELVRKQQVLETMAQEAGLTYVFGPVIAKLMRYHEDFSHHADALVLQSQRFQISEEYESWVEALIDEIKAGNPDVEVWVMVSVNPPDKRHATPDEIINDIQLVADRADLIWIYFGPQTASVMEEVFRRLRQ